VPPSLDTVAVKVTGWPCWTEPDAVSVVVVLKEELLNRLGDDW
jgi:hypothetical protein